ncbi:MAG: hypothetical protein PHY92_04575 [Alphaproteobacteria bacterium]|nr:hypothetical protein [Alphaproteobacteria bacterium]
MTPFAVKQANVEVKQVSRRSGNCLVANFRESIPPVVWQLDLNKNPNIVVSLRGRDDEWDLGLAEPKGGFTAVAHFDNRDDAEEAYATVKKALMKGRASHSYGPLRWALTIIMVLIAAAVIGAQIGLFSGDSSQGDASSGVSKSSGQQLGVPLPADEVLTAPPQ